MKMISRLTVRFVWPNARTKPTLPGPIVPSNRISQSLGFLLRIFQKTRMKISEDTTMVEDYDSIESYPDNTD